MMRKIAKDTGTQVITRFSLWGTELPPYLNLNEVEAVVRIK